MKNPSKRAVALSGAVAAGLMGGASWGLITEGFLLDIPKYDPGNFPRNSCDSGKSRMDCGVENIIGRACGLRG